MDSVTATVPTNVPFARIRHLDVYALAGADTDFLRAWKAVQDAAPSSLIWTPCNEGHWIATRAPEIEAIYTDHTAFSSRAVLVPRRVAEKFQIKPTTLDPPEHTAYRKLLNAAILPADVDAARPVIRQVVQAAINRVLKLGRCEYIHDVAASVPLAVFLQMSGLPMADMAQLPAYNEPLIDENGKATDADIMDRFAAYLRPQCEARLARPGSDWLSRIICGEIDGRPLDLQEAVDMATTMMTGGVDTVISVLGLLTAHLACNENLRKRLVQVPDLLPTAIREMLRRYPIMTKARLVTRTVQLDGVTLEPGDMVMLPPLQGLDDRVFENPMTVDIDRRARPNLTFGAGVHRCPGMLLALTEIEIVLAAWLEHVPDFTLDPALPVRTRAGVLGAVHQLGLQWEVPRRTRLT